MWLLPHGGEEEMKTPCKDCEKREVGCHSSCFDWKAYRLKKDEEYQRTLQARIEEGNYYGYQFDRKKKMKWGSEFRTKRVRK